MVRFIHFSVEFLRIVWRVRSVIIFMLVYLILGAVFITFAERIPFGDALYFSCITGLTIGYGDVVMKTSAGRVISILIGLIGIIFTGLIVAVVVETVRNTLKKPEHSD